MKKFFVTFIFLLFFSSLSAETFNKIDITGNKRISDETVKVYGEVGNIGEDLSKSDLDKILNNLYLTDFFQDVSVEIQNKTLIIRLKEYPLINQLVLIGEKSNRLKEEIKKVIKSKENTSFIELNVREDVNTIRKLYSASGYNFSKVESKARKIDEDNIDLVFELDRGELTKISQINFTGDKKIKEKRLRDIIASEEEKFWKIISKNSRFSENLINLDKRLLKNYYKSIGYYDVQVTSSSAEIQATGNVNITYTINAGQRYTIDKIETNVDPVFDKKIFFPLKNIYAKVTGDYYSPFKIKKILENIDEIIEKNNLQFVEHNVKESIEDDRISLTFNIKEGKKILVERINIFGNNITNEDVIRSELLLDEGDPFTQLILDKSIAQIKSRNIFRSVKSNIKNGTSSDLRIIELTVEEKPTGEISAGAGIGTDGGSFAINIKENNWLGQGKKVGFDFAVSEESVSGEISYIDPNYDLLGNSIRYSLFNVTNDKPDQGYENKLFSAGVGTSFEQYKDIYTNLGLNISYDDLRTASNASASLKKQAGEFTELSADYGFQLDLRNRKFMPTDGSVTGFSQTLPLFADKPYLGNTFTHSAYRSFGEDIVGAGKLYLSSVNGLDNEDVRISKRKSLSTRRLRGFERGKVGPVDGSDHIGGNYVAAANLEASLPNFLPESTNTDVAFFLDFANVWGVDYDDTLDESNELRSTTGVAANWLSPIGPMTFVLSTNLSKADTDKTETFNFNLGTTF